MYSPRWGGEGNGEDNGNYYITWGLGIQGPVFLKV